MTKYGSDQVPFLLIDGYNVLGVTTEIEPNAEAETEETTALGDAYYTEGATGLKRAAFEQKGFYDDAAGSANEALVSSVGVSRVLCFGVKGNVAGAQFTGYRGMLEVSYVRSPARGVFHKASAKYKGNGFRDEGRMLHPYGVESAASGNTQATSVDDNGASSANGGCGYAQVVTLTLGGYTDLTLKVRHSADNVTFADLITFAAVTASPAAEAKTVSGAVNRYLASSWAFTGAGAGQSSYFFVGFARL